MWGANDRVRAGAARHGAARGGGCVRGLPSPHAPRRLPARRPHQQGQLGAGVGKRADAPSPQPVPLLRGKRLAGVACGDAHTLVVTGTQGRAPLEGSPLTPACRAPSLSPPPPFLAVTEPAVAPRGSNAASSVFAFGANDAAQLGLGQDLLDRAVPCKVPLLSGMLGRGVHVARVAAGANHSAAVTSAHRPALRHRMRARTARANPVLLLHPDCGDLYTWGSSLHGQCGHGHEDLQTYPRRVKSLLQQDRQVLGVALGGAHTLVFGSVEGTRRALPSAPSVPAEPWGDSLQSDPAGPPSPPVRPRRRPRLRWKCRARFSANGTASSCAPTSSRRAAP